MVKKKSILVLGTTGSLVMNALNKAELDVYPIYDIKKIKKSFFNRLLYRLQFSLDLKGIRKWFIFNSIDLRKYDLIIVMECFAPKEVVSYIRSFNKSSRIIYWLWDTIGTYKDSKILYNRKNKTLKLLELSNSDKYKCEIWSFDKGDCKKYNINYNNQTAPKYELVNENIVYDVFYCGMDKEDRVNILLNLEKILSIKNLIFKIFILNKEKSYKNIDTNIEFIENPIKYTTILTYISKSKCIVDIVQKKQRGLTWRPLEAMFYKKKLITNFTSIVEYDFYDKDNIFIIGKDDINNLSDFINSDYKEIDENIVNKYTINGWLKNFIVYK